MVAAITAALLLLVAIRYIRNPAFISDPIEQGDRAAELNDKLDPNTATAAQLAAIPNLGEKTAREIIAYREKFQQSHPNQIAFASLYSFLTIRGIGPAKLQSLTPYLTFPPNPTTTTTRPIKP